jgi:hypothetical protein
MAQKECLMQRDDHWPNPAWRQEFRVLDDGLDPADVDVQRIDVITWPMGIKYIVIPK